MLVKSFLVIVLNIMRVERNVLLMSSSGVIGLLLSISMTGACFLGAFVDVFA